MPKILQKILDYLFLLRIPLLAPVWTILILGWISGNQYAHFGGSFIGDNTGNSAINLWTILIGFSLIVASIYVVNQIVDIESDRINHKLFLLPNGIISVRTAWICAFLCAIIGIVTSFFYDGVILFLFIAGLLLGYLYNLPPFQLKNCAWGGVLANSLGHGMITFLVGWYASKIGTTIDTQVMVKGLLSSVAPALANGAVFLATTIPDADGDQLTGKKTFCVKYGEKVTAVTAALFCFGALGFSFFIENNFWVMAVPTIISLLFFVSFAIFPKRDLAFKTFKWPVFLLSFSVALFVPEYGFLILATFAGSRAYYQIRFGIEYPTFKSK
ncbi:MAG: UbiA family prenyltransferase [Fibrobacter sp.]|nr:UbiA family prenyltransferase [Fibrobacter sp.]